MAYYLVTPGDAAVDAHLADDFEGAQRPHGTKIVAKGHDLGECSTLNASANVIRYEDENALGASAEYKAEL